MHDDGLDAERDALNAAVDAVLAGAPLDAVAERLPPELRPLLAAGSRLARHRPSGDALRPGFVVGLGEQLRMDLRLSLSETAPAPVDAERTAPGHAPEARRASAFRPKDWWPIALAGVFFGFFAGVVVRSGGAQPGEALYPVRRGWEHVALPPEPGTIGRVESRLDRAWRRLSELRQAIEDGRTSDDSVLALVDALVTAYDDVLAIAGSVENDGRALRRARADADAAANELERLAVGRASPVGAALVHAGRRLRLGVAAAQIVNRTEAPEADPPRLLPGGERAVPIVPSPTEGAGQAPPSPAPSAPSERPTSEPTRTPAPEPTPTLVTPLPPSATATAVPTRTLPPDEPPPAATPPPPGLTVTVSGPLATATPLRRTPTPPLVPIEPTSTTRLPDPPTSTPPPPSATATRPPVPTPTPLPTPTRDVIDPPPPTVSPHTATPAGEPPTPKPPPTDALNPTATPPPPQPSATVVDPGAARGGRGRGVTARDGTAWDGTAWDGTAPGVGRRPGP